MCYIVGKMRDIPGLKINTSAISEAADHLRMWKESRTYGLFSKSGLVAIHVYLLAIHMSLALK